MYLVRVEVGKGLVGGPILGLVVQNVMTMGECASLHVLAGQTDVDPFLQQGTEGQSLAHSPVDLTILHHFTASLRQVLLKISLLRRGTL